MRNTNQHTQLYIYIVTHYLVTRQIICGFCCLFPRLPLSNRYIRSLLRPARPERFADMFSFSPVYCNHPKPSSLLFLSTRSFKNSSFPLFHGWGQWFYMDGSCSTCGPFLRFGRGRRFHKVQFHIFRNPLEVPTTRFAIFSLEISFDVFSILRSNCRLVSAVSSLGPLGRCYIPDVSAVSSRSFVVPGFLVPHWPGHISCDRVPRTVPLCTAGHPHSGGGQLLAPSTIFPSPSSPKEFPFPPCHCSMAGRPFFVFWWRSAASFRTLRHFLGSQTGITAASSLGISWCSSTDYIIPGSCSVFIASRWIFDMVIIKCSIWRYIISSIFPSNFAMLASSFFW
jgi:hypothetical protein